MFQNLINRHDIVRVAQKLREGALPRLRGALALGAEDRTRAAWAQTDRPPKHWHDIPAVRRRWNRLVTGNENTDVPTYVARRYFAERSGIAALSVGCGTGAKEVRWAQTGAFAHLHAVDISDAAIAEARRRAESEGCADTVAFEVADVRTMPLDTGKYDVILADSALHHFSPLAPVVARLSEALRPSGLLMLRDFVGPARFQWTDRQMEAVRGMLALLPPRYRTRWGSGGIKRAAYRPGRLTLTISDPSEAAESDRTLGLLGHHLRLVERRDFGGTLLHPLFDGIAHHFLGGDPETERWLRLCFDAEDALLASGEVGSDFVFAVYEKPTS